LAERTTPQKIDWSSVRTQWLLAILVIFLVMSGIWASVFTQGIKPSRDIEFVPVSMRANAQADYSSDPSLSFRPVSLAIVEDILSDELTSNEEVADRLDDFEAKLQAPIPNLNPNNQGEEQVSIPPSVGDKNASEVEKDEDNEEDGGEDNNVEDEDDTSSTSPPTTNDQPDVLDPDDEPPGNSGNAPGQSKDKEPPGQSKDEEPPGQSKDEEPPGQSKDKEPPGQSEDKDPPGQSKDEDPPGQSDDSPGNSGDAPGKNKDKDKNKTK